MYNKSDSLRSIWDDNLNGLLDDVVMKIKSQNTVIFNNKIEVWISDYSYGE